MGIIIQIVAAYAMVEALNRKGYNGYSFSVPSLSELQEIFGIAAPVFLTMVSKVYHYSGFTFDHLHFILFISNQFILLISIR